jgi:hypothetical protein
MPDVAVGSDDHKLIGHEGISVKLSLFPILANVIFPLGLPGSLVECADHAVARTYDKQVAHDRGSREDSAAGIKFPENLCIAGRCRCVWSLSRDKSRKE